MSNKNSKVSSAGQCGGAIRMPAEYFGQDSGRYHAPGSKELATPSCQRPASFGTIFADGTVGPVLRTQTGGKHRRSHSKRRMTKKLSVKLMRKKLSRMSKRISKRVQKMRKNISMSL